MKKLMIAAASAAMISGAFAALPEVYTETTAGSMYSVAISIKTLIPTAAGGIKTTGCPICPGISGEYCHYFEQGTVKINGLFASCGCADMFTYSFFWTGSGKKAIPLSGDKINKNLFLIPGVAPYTQLPADWIDVKANRFGKTNKKAAAEIAFDDGDGCAFKGVAFGSYTDAKYTYVKSEDTYYLKTPAKINVSGSIVGTASVAKLAILKGMDPAEEYGWLSMDDACTVQTDCGDLVGTDVVPAVGTISIKPMAIKALEKAIPAGCLKDEPLI